MDEGGRRRRCLTYTVEVKIGDRFQRLPTGFRDEGAAEELGRKVERLANLRAAGEQPDAVFTKWLEGLPNKLRDRLAGFGLLTGRAAAATRKLAEHLADYRQALLDGVASPRQKGPATAEYADLVLSRVTKLLAGIGATFVADVTPEAVGRWLAEQRAKARKLGGLGVQSSNHYVTNAKSFLNWMIRAKRTSENPLACVPKLQVTAKARRHVRRALETDEAAALLTATRSGPVRYGMDAESRYWLYRLALETALRSGELRTLTPASFHLDADEPHVFLPGDDTKNRTDAELPLRADTVAELRAFLKGKPDRVPVFATMPARTAVAKMLRSDLAAARTKWLEAARTDAERTERERSSFLEIADGAGRELDFHALRGTCLSWLAAAGVPVKTLQTFARHSTPVLTMNVYARTLHGGLADAAARLPNLSDPPAREAAKKTGTYDAVACPAAVAETGGHTGGQTGGKPVPLRVCPTPSVPLGGPGNTSHAEAASVASDGTCGELRGTEGERRGWDSNPRTLARHRFSRPAP